MVVALLTLNLILVVAAQFLLKAGMNSVGGFGTMPIIEFFVSAATSLRVISGVALYALSAVSWLVLLSKTELSMVYPMISISYIFVLIISALFLGEQVGFLRIVGTLLIILGVILIYKS
ncbi:MAG: EamA family transporter [Candidatus Cloacimonetes bacterium]|nr:EamA family transporter [Candidatus Cloacimonadota bacterium]